MTPEERTARAKKAAAKSAVVRRKRSQAKEVGLSAGIRENVQISMIQWDGVFGYTRQLTHKEWTAILAWPGYRVYRHELDEAAKTLKLWVRRKPVHRGFECSRCGRRLYQVHDVREREIRDLPWSVYRATLVVKVHRLRCPECGVRVERIEQLPSKAPFSKRFEEIVGEACESAAASQVARRFHLPETTDDLSQQDGSRTSDHPVER
jgi:ribosomal protein L34E